MLIRQAFSKDISRPINGVVKANQVDDAAVVWQELDEYVVTRELDSHLRKFISAYLAAVDRPRDTDVSARVGAWVSGFFGSGKSHFIKIISYLLADQPVLFGGQARRPIEFFESKVSDPLFLADLKRAVATAADVILFNIDSKANKKDLDPILSVFVRVFDERLGYSSDHPHIARLERELEARGKLAAFQDGFRELAGAEWVDERDAYDFRHDEMVGALTKALGQSEESSRKLVEDSERNATMSPEGFAKIVREYLDLRGPKHRILFLIDEVGQFIGDETQLMLRLQTITENLGTACEGRAWVVVTSQENLDAVIGEVRASKANDFSKIQGRFATRLSLSSSNTDEVIQARILAKTVEAEAELRPIWEKKGDILRNQLSFRDNKRDFALPKGPTDFADNYPFVPHQFQLVQRVFEEVRRHGATGLHLSRGERSMLEAFKDAALRIADRPVGALAPLYAFYPSIESFLDTLVKRSIDQAAENPKLESFDIEVLKTLFLIKYVEEMRGNPDNLTTLCLDEIDADRLALRRRVQESLDRLEGQNYVSRNGDEYAFLTNEEQDVNREIKDVALTHAEETKRLAELIFGSVVKEPFRHRHQVNRKDFGFNPFVDGAPARKPSDENDLEVRVVTPLADDYAMWDAARGTMQSAGCVISRLGENKDLGRELRLYLQTGKYIASKGGAGNSPSFERILRDRAADNREREKRLIKTLEEMLHAADYYVAGQSRPSEGAAVQTILGKHLDFLIESLFGKLGYLAVLQESDEKVRSEIVAVLKANDIGQQSLALDIKNPNIQAYEDVRQYLRLSADNHHKIVLKDLAARYEKRPFGWPEWETALIVARLIVLGEIQIVMDGDIVETRRAWEPLSKTQTWSKVQIVRRKVVDSAALAKARKIGNEVFGQMGPDTEDMLVTFLKARLAEWQGALLQHRGLAEDGRYPGKEAIARSLKLIAGLMQSKDSFGFISDIVANEVVLQDLAEDNSAIHGFFTTQKPTWDRLLKTVADYRPNLAEFKIEEDAADAWKRIGVILEAKEPYNLLKEADGLIAKVKGANDARVEARRSQALATIQARIDQTYADVKRLDDGVAENGLMRPLGELAERIKRETVIGNIAKAETDVVELAHMTLARLEKIFAEKNKPDAPALPKLKPIRAVKASTLTGKVYLESEEDVSTFIANLQTELEKAIAAGERVEIR
jgi:hypothetical protein